MERLSPGNGQAMILLTHGSRTILAKRPNNLDYDSAVDLALIELGLSGDKPITLLVNWRGHMAEVQWDTFKLAAAETDHIYFKEEQPPLPGTLKVLLEGTANVMTLASIAVVAGLGLHVSSTYVSYAHLTGTCLSR
jgi:hypothetical protein